MVAQMGLQLMPLILLMTPSASISLLLPDNFILHDALGRSHSLRVSDFCDWSVLESLVKSRFRDCIGSEKVQTGQYTIFDVDDPTFDLGANNWTQKLKSRGRFRMAIRLSGVRLVNAKCASCGTRLRYFDKLHLVCPNSDCAKLMRSHTAQKPTATMIKAITGSTGGFLEPPTDTGSSQSKMLRLQRLEERFSWMARGTGISWEKSSHGAGRSATTHAAREMSALQSGTAPSNEGSETASMGPDDEDFDLDSGEAIAKQLQEPPIEDALLPMSTETTESQLLQEEEEMKYFRSICIKQDTTLYEAAVSRDSEAARSLIDMGVEVNSNLGPLGTALIPAILTRSLALVRMFLLANADPMEKCWGYQTALSLAVSFGGTAVFELVLRFAVSQSSHRPPAFQYAIDGALYEATLLDKPHIIASLLVAGANPVKIVRGDRSAFDVVLARRLKYAWPRFFAALWDRQLLSDLEARFLYECLTTESEDWQPANSWLDSCARNLRISNAKTLSQRVTARLGKKCFFRHGSRGPGVESATTPIQWGPSTPYRNSGLSMDAATELGATDVTMLSGGWALSASPDSRIPGIFVDASCVELPDS
ncbi:hypothetical protein ColLi_02347 [Colletotrichum liriopes]|uniref:Ubiquitin-like domain-containing protein n=1 Tax=Colletotrichum liriopes TaxID=708192 RepID=A0AA37LNW4_9PEZI|nr:hypothetical protein ColLi_02347 [Colletotrichum liriopes]